MKTKYYFQTEDDEYCYQLSYFLEEAKENELTEIELIEAIPYRDSDYFWCRELGEYGEKGENTCGKSCEDYKPLNGKSGCCKHYTNIMYEHGNKIKILTNQPKQ